MSETPQSALDLIAIRIRLSELAGRMALADWALDLDFDGATDRLAYTAYHDDGYRSATVFLGPGFPGNPSEWDEHLAHELAHVLVAGWSIAARDALREVPKPLRRALARVIDREEEAVCDRIARLVR